MFKKFKLKFKKYFSNKLKLKHEEFCKKCKYSSNCTKDTGGTYSCRVSRYYEDMR